MAISGQETLQIGAQNSPTNSDSLWIAFNKTQNNFSTLFSEASPYNVFTGNAGISVTTNPTSGTVNIVNTGVLSLIQGTGITLSGANGNIVVSAVGGSGGAGVTSVGISTNTLSVSNTPVVSAGNITVDLPIQANVLSGNYIAPTMSVDQYGRITNIANASSFGTVTSVAVSGGTGISVSGGPITTTGTITVTNTGVTRLTAGTGIVLTSNTGAITISATAAGGGGGSAAGNTGEIQFNLSDNFSSSSNLSYDSSNNILNVGNLLLIGSNSAVTYANGLMAASQITSVPSTAASTGIKGQIAFDTSHIYICIATDTWMRAAIATW